MRTLKFAIVGAWATVVTLCVVPAAFAEARGGGGGNDPGSLGAGGGGGSTQVFAEGGGQKGYAEGLHYETNHDRYVGGYMPGAGGACAYSADPRGNNCY